MEERTIRDYLLSVWRFLTNRVSIVIVLTVLCFYLLTLRLFELQIVNGDMYQKQAKENITKDIPISAQRGQIYDKFGRPLAVNEVIYSIKVDTSVKPKNAVQIYTRFVELTEKNGEKIDVDFPITDTKPYEFTYATEQRREWWKRNMDMSEKLTAQECIDYLREFYELPEDMPEERAWKIIALMSAVYMERYNMNHLTVCLNVSRSTVTAIEEHSPDYPGLYVSPDYLRHYPEGKLLSHVIGYTGRISADELERYKDLGYTADDKVGKTGIEKAFELQLGGTDGEITAEIGPDGRRVGTLGEQPTVPGDNVVLTIDRDLQEKSAQILEKYIKQILINKLEGKSAKEAAYTERDLLISMTKAQNISVKKIMESGEESLSFTIREYVEKNSGIDLADEKYMEKATLFIADSIEKNNISASRMILAMYEQGVITLTDDEISRLQSGREATKQLLIRKVYEDEITPQKANLMPATGSAVVVDTATGSVLAAASYPSYDNNELANVFNNEYYAALMNDPTTPMVNRPFTEPRPPGSTFKMLTGIAGLENGVISPQTTIYDKGIFTDAGQPYAKCRPSSGAGGYHGAVNVVDALKVSCNYFFYDVGYRLGNTKLGSKFEGIAKLNKVMTDFGLGDRTGVEIGELYDSYPDDLLKVSSPEYKEFQETSYDPNATTSQTGWVDGDTIRTAIGQGYNNYTCASMVKYIATLANKGARFQLHLTQKLESSDGNTISTFEPNLEKVVDVKPENMNAILEGMKAVTTKQGGTAYGIFSNFPITVGGKTGTAEQGKAFAHTTFGGFAPFEDPQVAVFVIIPFGDTLTMSGPATQVARDILAEYFGLNTVPEPSKLTNELAR